MVVSVAVFVFFGALEEPLPDGTTGFGWADGVDEMICAHKEDQEFSLSKRVEEGCAKGDGLSCCPIRCGCLRW